MDVQLVDIQDIDALPEEVFDLQSGISNAKKTLSKLENQNVLLVGEFEDDFWKIENHLIKGQTHNFDFSELDKFRFVKTLPSEFNNIVKSWIAELFNQYYVMSVRSMYSILLRALEWTNGFEENKVKTLLNEISEIGQIPNQRFYFNTLFNFLNYSELPATDIYTPQMINEYRKVTHNKMNVRRLPPSSEVLKFSHHLEKYIDEIISYEGEQYLKEKVLYYPVYLWWKLTTIIPLRASEFCNIGRDALIEKDNSFYIKLPRIKNDYDSKDNHVITEIEITEDVYNHFLSYHTFTKKFGKTETMCSFRSLLAVDGNSARTHKNDRNYFHSGILGQLITRFYKEILSEKYQISICQEDRLTPNLTRHIAFCSLLMQGISPVEIARLGGHKTISSQYHYSYHVEYWVDSEVFKLMNKFKRSSVVLQHSSSYVPDDIKLVAYKPIPHGVKEEDFRKVEIGYCTDKMQRCETEECYLGCRHWRISPQEIIEKEEVIRGKITEKRREIRELQAFIENFHKQILIDELVRKDPQTYTKLRATANEIDDCIHDLTRLNLLH